MDRIQQVIERIKEQHPDDYMHIHAADSIWNTLAINYGIENVLVAAISLGIIVGQCAWCENFHLGEYWYTPAKNSFGDIIKKNKHLTHTICPVCLKKRLEENKQRKKLEK